MPIFKVLLSVLVSACLCSTLFAQNNTTVAPIKPSVNSQSQPSKKLPPCPPGVNEVAWSEFFKTPVGPLGLELTDKIKSLDGKKVRLFGYMVRREEMRPGSLLLAPVPLGIEDHEGGFSDLPPQTVRVSIPYAPKEIVAYTNRPLLLTGTLTVGRREDAGEVVGGEVSWFNLSLDEPKPIATIKKSKTPVKTKPAAKIKR